MYQVYVKSHSEAQDFIAEYSEEQLEDRICQIPYANEDEDGFGFIKCGGTLIDVPEGYKCKRCLQTYSYEDELSIEQEIEKAEALHDDYLEANATGN